MDSVLTPITVNSVACSLRGWPGMAADSASAADAPQIATAPPVSKPKNIWKPSSRASTMPTTMVSATASTWLVVMRKPSSATPRRSTCRAVKSMPAALRVLRPLSS